MIIFKKTNAKANIISTSIRKTLLGLQDSKDIRTWKHQFWILAHGTYLTAAIGQVLLGASYACTLTSTPNEYEFIYSSAVYGMLALSGIYQIFWLRFRRTTATMFQRLLPLATELEAHCDDEELQMCEASRRMMMIVVRGFQMTFVGETFSVCGQPILDARLPEFMRGMKAFSPGMLAIQALHVFVMVPIGISCCAYLTTQTKLVFYLTVGYKLLGKRLKLSAMTDQEQMRHIVRLHSEWTSLSGDSEKYFAAWNTLFLLDMGLMALLGTVGIISGVLVFEIIILAPSVLFYVFVMCRLGELLRQHSSDIADDIYKGNWLDGTLSLRKLILLPILRSHRPAIIRATIIGPLTLETFLTLIKNWYRILQCLVNLK